MAIDFYQPPHHTKTTGKFITLDGERVPTYTRVTPTTAYYGSPLAYFTSFTAEVITKPKDEPEVSPVMLNTKKEQRTKRQLGKAAVNNAIMGLV